jgi:predicted DNA-binding transcriptional regulator AlpA
MSNQYFNNLYADGSTQHTCLRNQNQFALSIPYIRYSHTREQNPVTHEPQTFWMGDLAVSRPVEIPKAKPTSFMKQKQLEQWLGVSAMTIYLWRKEEDDPFPCRTVPTPGGGARIFFSQQDVLEWIKRNRPNRYEALMKEEETNNESERVPKRMR